MTSPGENSPLRSLPAAMLGALAACAAELAVVATLERSALASSWELRMGALWLLPQVLLLCAPGAALATAVATALTRPGRLSRGAFVLVAGALGAGFAWLVSTGRHFAALDRRVAFVSAVALVAVVKAALLHGRLGAALRGRPAAFAAGAAVATVAVELANRFVLVRLYPGFHLALAFAATLLSGVGALAWRRARAAGRAPASARVALGRAGVLAVVLAGAAATARPAAERLSLFDNFRLLLAEGAPLWGEAVRFAAELAPPPPIAETDPCLLSPGACTARATAAAVSFASRDVLLVSIDALRADHVGAYGYGRPTTPAMDRLAREGVVFEHAYAPTPHTSYSVTSVMTGKYMRPLLLQGVGQDSDTLPSYFRKYGYRTAAFYPPAVFFIDAARFEPFERAKLGFEYAKVEFMEGEGRVAQVDAYLKRLGPDQRLFLWVHLFGPHEPYAAHAEHPFGDRDVDRYDSEVAAADATLGAIVERLRSLRPGAIVIVTADHGEEFGEHGGRYHGSSVYEEQVHVPLIVSAPGLLPPHRVGEVVQTIDLAPTLLATLSVPRGPRLRGRDLSPLLASASTGSPGQAFAETDEQSLLAQGPHRLVCARRLGACRLYDLEHDPDERTDVSTARPEVFDRMRAELRALGSSHGRFEQAGQRTETGRAWPPPILRAIAGDADVASELSSLLDDSDRELRRKAAELLFRLHRAETTPALRLALSRDEDPIVRSYAALALTRLGQGAPLTLDVLAGDDVGLRRLAALALAESGDRRGEAILVDWWQHGGTDDHERALELLGAFARLRSRDAVWPLVKRLDDVRLRPRIAQTLAVIGDDTARGPLVAALSGERYQTARIAITDAIVALGGKEELARPLVRFLGVPDPLPAGLGAAVAAGILAHVGGPEPKVLARLGAQSDLGVRVPVVVPRGGNGRGVRVIVRASADGAAGEVRVGLPSTPLQQNIKGKDSKSRKVPQIHGSAYASLGVPAGPVQELHADLPGAMAITPGRSVELVVFAERHVRIEALALVPLADELPPPPPEPWSPDDATSPAPH